MWFFQANRAELPREASVPFSHFDILTDEEVRLRPEESSRTGRHCPQFYANGELVDCLDILKEMVAENAIQDSLISNPSTITSSTARTRKALNERLKALTSPNLACISAKGSPDNERCGFSRTIVALFGEHSVEFDSFDILTDNDVPARPQEVQRLADVPAVACVDGGRGPGHRGDGRRRRAEGPVGAVSFVFTCCRRDGLRGEGILPLSWWRTRVLVRGQVGESASRTPSTTASATAALWHTSAIRRAVMPLEPQALASAPAARGASRTRAGRAPRTG